MVALGIVVLPLLQNRIVYCPEQPGCPFVLTHLKRLALVVGGGGKTFVQHTVLLCVNCPHGFWLLPNCPLNVAAFVIWEFVGNVLGG